VGVTRGRVLVARGIAAGLVACAAASGCAADRAPERGEREADRWLGVDRSATFRAHVQHVASIAVSPEPGLARLGTAWGDELRGVERRYREAVSRDDAYYALVALANSLHDGHAYLRAEALAPAAPAVTVPLSVRVEDEGGAVRYVVRAGGEAPAGAAIVAVDGTPVDRLEREWLPWFDGGSSPEGLREALARWMARRDPERSPTPRPGERTTLRVREAGGAERDVSLEWRAVGRDESACAPYAEPCAADADGEYAATPVFEGLGACVYTTDDPSTRVVRYRTLWMPETRDPAERACLARKLPRLSYALTVEEADASGPRGLLQRDQGELLDHLARAGVRRVLFDVRENRGGDFDPVFFGAFTGGRYAQPLKRFVYGPFFREDPERVAQANPYVALLDGEPLAEAAGRIVSFLRENPNAGSSPALPFYCQTRACAEGEAFLRSRSNVVFRAAVLTGPRCFSACDDFVAMFRGNGIAPTVGVATAAGDSPYAFDTTLALADGQRLSLHLTVGVSFMPGAEATPLDAHPAPVDVPLPPTASNRGRYVAEALARVPW
jgi:hypothetical protein